MRPLHAHQHLTLTLLAATLAGGFAASVQADSAKLINPDNHHAYQRFDTGKTWTEAKAACETLGAHLATATSQEETAWLIDNQLYDAGGWLGATDAATEGQWQWITGEAWDYTNWYSGEPNNAGNEDYLQYGGDGRWNDLPKSWVMSYLCEWESTFSPIVSLGDVNNDGSPEIAVVTYDTSALKTTATVKNAATGILIKQIAFNGHYAPQKVNTVNDLNGNGASEIAVLGVRSSDQAVQVEIRDSLTGAKIRVVPFPATWPPLDLGIVRNVNGPRTAALAVLQQSDTALRVQLKDATSGAQLRTLLFSPGYDGIDINVIGDLNGNQTQELVVLLDNKDPNGSDKVEIRDSGKGQLLRGIGYGSGKTPRQVLTVKDVNGNDAPEFAVLRENTARVAVKDAKTGVAINTLDYSLSQPYKLAGVADAASGIPGLALLGVRASDGQIRADVHNVLSDTRIGSAVYEQYGTTVGFIAIPDINGNGVAELVRLREQPGPQKYFAEVRDGRTGKWIQGMYF